MLKACNLQKKFGALEILKGVNLEIAKGTSCAIVGKSGIGKSTLIHILGALESCDGGSLYLGGTRIEAKNSDDFRKQKVGFIFQNFNLIEDFSVIDNLRLAALIRSQPFNEKQAYELLCEVELEAKAKTFAKHLSGGEKQRLAIARALAHNPELVLADEPTGSLDETQGALIEELLFQRVKKEQAALVIVTHDLNLAKKCDQILQLKEGILYIL